MDQEPYPRISLAEHDRRTHSLALYRLAWGAVSSMLYLGACFALIDKGHDAVGCVLAIVYIFAATIANLGRKG
jgi:hypothetical protein